MIFVIVRTEVVVWNRRILFNVLVNGSGHSRCLYLCIPEFLDFFLIG